MLICDRGSDQYKTSETVSLPRSALNNIVSFSTIYRYLVIIDDIWHYGEWETIKKSLPDNNLGSRIVTTSRLNAIAEKWRDDFVGLQI